MSHLLLLGAGFSRNWGGWLAEEFFESLLGAPEVASHPILQPLLWKYRPGGFESLLDDLQRKPAGRERELLALQNAIKRMFAEMNARFATSVGFCDTTAREFLPRFDAIFSLNQDLLVEMNYIHNESATLAGKGRTGTVMPGLRRVRDGEGVGKSVLTTTEWSPDGALEKPRSQFQPFYKLHGSTNWRLPTGEDLLVIGGAKSAAIQSNPILQWYHAQFEEAVCASNARLMVIGYSFSDAHINAVIQKGVDSGLKLFLIDPLGVEVLREGRGGAIPGRITHQNSIIGASRRPFRDVMGNDPIEREKVMRFFS